MIGCNYHVCEVTYWPDDVVPLWPLVTMPWPHSSHSGQCTGGQGPPLSPPGQTRAQVLIGHTAVKPGCDWLLSFCRIMFHDAILWGGTINVWTNGLAETWPLYTMYIANLWSHMIILRIDLYRILKHQHLQHASFWIIQYSGEEQAMHQF